MLVVFLSAEVKAMVLSVAESVALKAMALYCLLAGRGGVRRISMSRVFLRHSEAQWPTLPQ